MTRRRSAAAKAEINELRDDYKWLMANRQGRRLMWRWLVEARIYASTFTGTRQGDFLEGKRALGLKLVEEIHLFSPEMYAQMQLENRKAAPEKPPSRTDDIDDESDGQ